MSLEFEKKLEAAAQSANEMYIDALNVCKTEVPKLFRFTFRDCSSSPLLNSEETAQFFSFITKLDSVKRMPELQIIKEDGFFRLNNLDQLKQMINELRPVIMNQKDKCNFNRINSFCYRKLSNEDPDQGLCIKVFSETNDDITGVYKSVLDEHAKAVRKLIENSEFDYLYNVVLQHADQERNPIFQKDYASGEINYKIIIHALKIIHIKKLLRFHYSLINQIVFPKMGSL
ncbi:hypothetical protein [Paenibacillus phytohabitans]|uniref:hypothetical protein n=1 Tax=Paenibacillus phytohabitans TaxID=2654978 RepID=UPI00300A5B4F